MSTTSVIRSNTGAFPPPAYTTIGAWTTAAAAASWSGGWIGECYNDSQFNEDVSMTAVSSSDYGILRAAAGQSAFDNTANPLTYDVSKGVGIHAFASTFVITVGSYTTIERLQFNSNNAFGLTASIYNSTANFANKCLFYKSDTGTCGRVGGGATVTNCVFISEISIGVAMAYAATTVFVNNTVVAPSDKSNSSIGLFADYTPKIANCNIFGFSGGAIGLSRGTPTGSNNATDYATLPFGTGNQTGLTYANQFNGITTTGGLDYRLKTGTSIGASAGVDETLYIPANDDIFSTARSTGQWSIGAFQPTGGGGGGTHPSSGALIGPGSTVAGSAKRFRAHPSTGALVGPGSTVVGTAVHKTKHVTSGALVGPGARIVGVAAHWHKTTGALIGPGSTVAGTAVHYTKHATSGVLTGPGSTISGSAAHTASVHTTTGALIGPGAFIAGTALHISTAVTVLTPTRGGLPPTKKDRDRYLARERLLDEIRAERVRAKRLENDELEQQLTQLFVQVPNVPEPAPAQPKPLKRSAKKQREAVQPAMDFQPILAKLAEIKIELQKFEEDEDDVEALLLL